MTDRWHVAHTEWRKEPLARTYLRGLGYETAFPLTTVNVRQRTEQPWRGPRHVPMFPSYLFVRFDPDDPAWRRIATQPGIRSILGSSPETPTALPDGVVEDLVERAEVALEALARGAVADNPYSPGDRLRVLLGPFERHLGDVLRTGAGRVTLLLLVFGHARPVDLPVDAVELAR